MEYIFRGVSYHGNELLVLNYHGTPKKFLGEFNRQLDFLAANFEFISPSRMDEFYTSENFSGKPKLLLTFDDGIQNNKYAAEILHQRGISALFLVIPGFVDCPAGEQEIFFREKIRPAVNPSIDGLPEDKTALSWDELGNMIRQGHAIGSHSYTHTMEAGKISPGEMQTEISGSKKRIAEMLSCEPVFFCGPNNSLFSCGKPEMEIIKKEYRFFLSTFPGTNAADKNPFFIRRSNVETFWLQGAFLLAIGSWDRKRWIPAVRKFREIAG